MLEQLFESYLKEKRLLEGKSELTIKSYRQAFNRYKKACGNELPDEELPPIDDEMDVDSIPF